MDPSLRETTDFVRELAARQGKHILSRWSSIGRLDYNDQRDVTTRVDREVERAIIGELRERFPDHGFSGEETGLHNPEAEYRWLIDPIDGTKYFAGRSSLFAVSIALFDRGEPVLGVVYNAPARQCFHAHRGGGAYLEDQRLTGPEPRRLDQVIANVDTPKSDRLSAEERRWFEARLVELTRRIYRIRALGLGSLAACWLATGAFDAYLDLTGYVDPEDIGAGWAILREAGLRAEYVEVEIGPPRLLAAPEDTFGELAEILG